MRMTLYFETDKADGFREPGFSKERRLEPQITVGLLTDETGFPLRAGAFEGSKAETATMIPMINDFMDAYNLDDVVVVADAGMISAANKQALEKAGLSYVLGSRTPARPPRDQLLARQPPRPGRPRRADPESQSWPAGPSDQRRDETIYYRYSADRARRTLRGIDTQVAKAEKAVAGKIPVKRNRFVHLSGATRSINRDLEKRARTLAGWKGYVTNLPNPDPETVISAYHRLYNIEKSFAHVQVRPENTPRLPPPAPVHRGPPDHRHRSPCHGPLAGDHHRLVHQTPDHHRTPLPHHHHQHRRTHPHSC